MIHVPPLVRVPPPPRYLDHEEKAAWRALVPKLVAARVLTVLDRAALEQLCWAWCAHRRCARRAREARGRERRLWQRSAASGRRLARTMAAEFFLVRRAGLGLVDPTTGEDLELRRIFRRPMTLTTNTERTTR